MSNQREIIAAADGPPGDGADWNVAGGAIAAGAPATVDFSAAGDLSVSALCEVAGLVREARRAGTPVHAHPPSPWHINWTE